MPKRYIVEPLGSWVWVDIPKQSEKVTEGGIIIPEKAVPRPVRGVVLAVGPGAVNIDTNERIPIGVDRSGTPLKPGDEVLINPAGARCYELDGGQKVYTVHEGDIIAKLVPETEGDEGK
jgi:chaperonin GroES